MSTIKVVVDAEGRMLCPWHGDPLVTDDDGETWQCADAKVVWDVIRRDLAAAFDRLVINDD